jgi:hypothetical protein
MSKGDKRIVRPGAKPGGNKPYPSGKPLSPVVQRRPKGSKSK